MAFKGILQQLLLKESADPEQVCKAIDNHSYVIINYHTKGEDDNTGSRVIIPVAYGLTSASNPVLRAWQPFGDSTTKARAWKYFRLDRISYWEETKTRFTEKDLPDPSENEGDFNPDGDNLMQVVNHMVRFGSTVDATNGVNVGPKTREKIGATPMSDVARTSGDEKTDLARRNLDRMNGGIKVDLDNNRKANATFNVYTDNTPVDAGPREPDMSYKPRNVSGSPDDGDINSPELQKLRQQVKNTENDRTDILNNDDLWNQPKFSDYEHNWTDDEISKAKFDQAVMNREPWKNQNLSASRRKWDRYENGISSADRMFKNKKDSGNRVLYNMDKERKSKKEEQ